MDRLSGSQTKQLQNALLSAFSIDDLSQLMKLELDTVLESVVSRGPMTTVTFEVIMWAEREGRTAKLIEAAMAARPNNREVTALSQLLPSVPAGPAVNAADLKRRLRGVLLDQFPRRSDLKILLADTLDQSLDAVAGGETQTEVCFNLVGWLWTDPDGRLKPFLVAAVQERPNNAEFKALQQEVAKL